MTKAIEAETRTPEAFRDERKDTAKDEGFSALGDIVADSSNPSKSIATREVLARVRRRLVRGKISVSRFLSTI